MSGPISAIDAASGRLMEIIPVGDNVLTSLNTFTPDQVEGFSSSGGSGGGALTTAQMASMTVTVIAAIPATTIAGLTTTQIAAMTPTQAGALSTAYIGGLTSVQINALSAPAQAAIAAFSTGGGGSITTTQLVALTSTQLAVLTSTQLAGLTPQIPISAFTTTQIESLTTTQLASLTTTQIAAIPNLTTMVPNAVANNDYTFVLSDQGKSILNVAANTVRRYWHIPANGTTAFPIGTFMYLHCAIGSGGIIIDTIDTDVLKWAPAGTTGPRTLAAGGVASLFKNAATEWTISGSGLT